MQWWTRRHDNQQIQAVLDASANPAALRRTVGYVALNGTLSSTEFADAKSRDPILRKFATSELIGEAIQAGFLHHIFSPGLPVHGYTLTDAARSHREFFLAGIPRNAERDLGK